MMNKCHYFIITVVYLNLKIKILKSLKNLIKGKNKFIENASHTPTTSQTRPK